MYLLRGIPVVPCFLLFGLIDFQWFKISYDTGIWKRSGNGIWNVPVDQTQSKINIIKKNWTVGNMSEITCELDFMAKHKCLSSTCLFVMWLHLNHTPKYSETCPSKTLHNPDKTESYTELKSKYRKSTIYSKQKSWSQGGLV